MNRSLVDWNMVKTNGHVQAGKVFKVSQSINVVVNQWERVLVFDSYLIQRAIVDTHPV